VKPDAAPTHSAGPAATDRIVVYTDGACSGNPGPGGWAWATAPDGRLRGAGGERATTNQRMEITAVLEALRALPADAAIEVVSDSTYVVHCFRDRWWQGWQRNGWKNAKKQPVANRDLWEPLVALYLERGRPPFRWVKGHSGDPMNDLVDRLAVAAVPR
jgi:ribonuclease HI